MQKQFVMLLKQLLIDIDKLDADTPWQEVEPEWWLAMMTLERMVRSFVDKFGDDDDHNTSG